MSHFSALRLATAAGLFSLLFQLSACGGGERPEASDAPTSRPNATLTASAEPRALPEPTLVDLLEASGQINAKELQAVAEAASGAIAVETTTSATGDQKSAPSLVPIYRFFNTRTASHFYTASLEERNNVIATLPTLQYEGIAFYASTKPARGLSPVYRFYNTQTGVHLYSISEAEKTNIQKNIPAFKYEGIAYYASQITAAGTSGLRRFFVRDRGFHFYSSSPEEAARIRATLPNYVDEGPAYYALTPGWSAPVDVDLRLGRWILTGQDTQGTRWDGSELVFTQQVPSGDNYSIVGRVNFLANGSPRGWEDFSGTLYADGRLEMSGYAVATGFNLTTADWKAVLNVAGNQFLNGVWSRADGRVIPGTWTAVR